MTDNPRTTLACGCTVETFRDFLQRVVGKVLVKGDQCARPEHAVDALVIMPGRENARPE